MMEHHEISELLKMLVVMLGAAKLFGRLARALGQPAVLGELIGGVVAGPAVLGWVDPGVESIQMFSELGVIVLLFAIGLETDVKMFLKVGPTSATVAVVGVVLPFVLGYAACRMLGRAELVAITAGAALTATSVGITARILSELGRLRDPEGQVILGAAVIDDVLGLVILAVVTGLEGSERISWTNTASVTASAFGFLAGCLVVGRFVVPWIFRLTSRSAPPGGPMVIALILALGLSWLADRSGSAIIIGAFAAGLLVAATSNAREVEQGVTAIGYFFVPLFFVGVGLSVDLGSLDPTTSDGRSALLIGGVLTTVGVVGKWLAGYAPFWFRGNKAIIGAGMIPRGEVGLIFAAEGLDHGVFDKGMFGAVTLMVMITTMAAPPLLKHLSRGRDDVQPRRDGDGVDDGAGIDDLVNEV